MGWNITLEWEDGNQPLKQLIRERTATAIERSNSDTTVSYGLWFTNLAVIQVDAIQIWKENIVPSKNKAAESALSDLL